MTAEDALLKLGESTAEAVAGVLGMFAPEGVERGAVSVTAADADPLAGIATPSVATSVSYVDGVTGGNVFVLTVAGCRKLAAAMMGADPDAVEGDEPLSELELSAVSEAMNQMMAAAAAATARVLGEEVEIGTPATQTIEAGHDTAGAYERTPHATVVPFVVFGEPCRLVQLIPNAFVVRMSRALAANEGEVLREGAAAGAVFGGDVLRGVGLRVWAELGRAQLPVGRAVGLARGSVLELDRGIDEPVDLYVNGRRFALGRLLLTDDGEWAVQIERLAPEIPTPITVTEGGR
jgi:flagellar motor switch protein FliN